MWPWFGQEVYSRYFAAAIVVVVLVVNGGYRGDDRPAGRVACRPIRVPSLVGPSGATGGALGSSALAQPEMGGEGGSGPAACIGGSVRAAPRGPKRRTFAPRRRRRCSANEEASKDVEWLPRRLSHRRQRGEASGEGGERGEAGAEASTTSTGRRERRTILEAFLQHKATTALAAAQANKTLLSLRCNPRLRGSHRQTHAGRRAKERRGELRQLSVSQNRRFSAQLEDSKIRSKGQIKDRGEAKAHQRVKRGNVRQRRREDKHSTTQRAASTASTSTYTFSKGRQAPTVANLEELDQWQCRRTHRRRPQSGTQGAPHHTTDYTPRSSGPTQQLQAGSEECNHHDHKEAQAEVERW